MPAKKIYPNTDVYYKQPQDHRIKEHIDNIIIQDIKKNIHQQRINLSYDVKNTDRAIGTMLSSYLTKKGITKNISDDYINIDCYGSAGQSFGAFLSKGITLAINGDANDYVGKGLSGGKIILCPPKK